MADNYKILAQTTAASVEPNSGQPQANVVYTVPANTQAAISSISLINSSTVSEDYYLGIVKSEDVSSSNEIFDTTTETVFNYEKILSAMWFRAPWVYDSKSPQLGFSFNQSLFSAANYNAMGIVYGSGRLVVILKDSSTFLHSIDSLTWTIGSLPISGSWSNFKFLNNTFVVTDGSSKNILYSTDGLNWTTSTLSINSQFSQKQIFFIDNKFFVFASDIYTPNTAFSTNLVSWSSPQYTPTTGNSIVQKENTLISASGGNIYMSTNGASWTTVLDDSEYWARTGTGAGLFIVSNIRSGGIDIPGKIAVSANGTSWTVYDIPSTNGFSVIQYILGKFYAQSDSGQTDYESTDGITWTVFSSANNPINIQQLIDSTAPLSLAYFPYQEIIVDGVLSTIEAIKPKNTIVPTRSIEPNTVDEITGGIALSAGDQIRVYSESDDLIVQVYGVEIS